MPGKTKDCIYGIITESRSRDLEKLTLKMLKKDLAVTSTIVVCKEGTRYNQKKVVVQVFILCRILDF